MSTERSLIRDVVRSWLPVLAALVIGFLAAHAERQPSTAQAEVRPTQERAAFKSGGARSETILQEISATLTRMDGRLARIERSVAADAKQK